ncbi:MAG: glycosyltransferase family 9 protein [Chitinophagaceae bacterium]|nr:glycosyltransferase family 9 protein [Chitinophagaceae bacterium]
MKFLIIRFSSIGDIVFTTPVVRCLKQQVPDAEVHYLTKFSFRQVISSNPYVDKFHYLNNDWDLLMHELKEEKFDYIIDLHHNLRTLRIKRALKVKAFSFNKLNIQKFLLVNFKINRMPDVHIVDRNLDTVKSFGVKNDGKGMDFFIPKEDEIKQTDLPHSHALGYIGIVIGAAHFTKRLPVEKLQQLCAALHHPVVLLGGPDDKEAGDAIAAIDNVKIYNACGKFSITESADLVRKAKLIIAHDTGLMHIAAALKKPVIAVWGNTMPLLGVAPYYGYSPVQTTKFEVSNLSCRPCSKIGRDSCPKKHFKCMNLQDVEAIAATAQAWAKTLR